MQLRLLSVALRAARDGHAVVSTSVAVRLRHGSHDVDAVAADSRVTAFVAARAVVSLEHGCSILISNSSLGDHHLLVFDEIVLAVAPVIMRMVQTIGVVPVVRLDLARVLLGTHSNHGAVRRVAVAAVVACILVLMRLRWSRRALRVADEDDVALIYGGVVRAAVRPLLVAPTEACTAAVVGCAQTDGEAAQVLTILTEVKERWSVGLLLTGCRRDVAGRSTWPGEVSVVLRHVVQLQLFLQSLVVDTALIVRASEVDRQVLTHIDHLRHVLDLVAETLSRNTTWVHELQATRRVRSEVSNAVRQVLVLRRRAVALDGVEVQMVLVGRATDAAHVHLVRYVGTALILLLLLHLLQLLLVLRHLHLVVVVYGVAHLTFRGGRYVQLLGIASCLRSSLDLILDVLRLLLVRVANRQALTYLHLLRLVKRVHLVL